MKLENVFSVLVIERDGEMRKRLALYFEARPDIEIIGFGRAALVPGERPDAIVVDMVSDDDMQWISGRGWLGVIPLIAFANAAGKQQDAIFRLVERPDTSDAQSVEKSLRLLAYAIRCAKEQRGMKRAAAPSSAPPAESALEYANIIAIGASAGGTQAIVKIVSELTDALPPIIAVQHIAAGFEEPFAEHVGKCGKLRAKVAKNGEEAKSGYIYIAPSGRQTTVKRVSGGYMIACAPGKSVSGHMPSINVLFDSVAREAGQNAVGVLLTGMGEDGARGLLNMRMAGACTIAQDEQTSVVYGMPRAAWELGAAAMQLPLDAISAELSRYAYKGVR